jgi:predicted TPR repeat methyltransferase
MNRAVRRKAGKDDRKKRSMDGATLDEAIRSHKAGHFAAAEVVYKKLLYATPDNPDALHFLGVLFHQTRRTEEGIALVRRSLAIAPEYVDAWSNLGNLYKESERLAEAETAYRQALALEPHHAAAWNNLGVVLRARSAFDESVAAFRRAIEISPKFASACLNFGNALRACGRLREAISAYRQALALDSGNVQAHYRLGNALYLTGDHAEAAEVFRDWTLVNANPIAEHMLAACSGENVPVRASNSYVQAIFDGFAESFDEVLLHRLDYHAPDLLAATLADVLGLREPLRDVLDAGCGTGLCGPLLRPYARSLTGVDLSSGMLEKARARAVYDHLEQDEITEFLTTRNNAFDVIVSADTLCYFGDLVAIANAARRALRPAGWLAFTVERGDNIETFRINPHGRYSHARAYVEVVLEAARFTAIQSFSVVLRKELGAAVEGWVVRAQVPSD